MPIHVKLEEKLNWLLWGLFGAVLASAFFGKFLPWLRPVIPVAAMVAFAWVVAIIWWRLTRIVSERRLYCRPTDGDYWRLFVVLLLGYGRIADLSPEAFLLASVFAVPLLFLLVTIGISDSVLEKSLSVRAIGCFTFAYFLFTWQKASLVGHFGVPIMGHFLEKPNYAAQYYVEAELPDSGATYTLLADIRVESRAESEETGEDRFGGSIYTTYRYRDIWVDRLYLPNGGKIEVDSQDEPISMDEPGFVTDKQGRNWRVKMSDRRVN